MRFEEWVDAGHLCNSWMHDEWIDGAWHFCIRITDACIHGRENHERRIHEVWVYQNGVHIAGWLHQELHVSQGGHREEWFRSSWFLGGRTYSLPWTHGGDRVRDWAGD